MRDHHCGYLNSSAYKEAVSSRHFPLMLSLDPGLQELYPRMVAERGVAATPFDKNLLRDELHITKNGVVCQEEKITRYGVLS
jgi:hypothetical protein